MLSFLFIILIFNNVPLSAMMVPSDEGISSDGSVIIEQEQEHKGEKSGSKVSFYPEVTPESRFLRYVHKFCVKRKSPKERNDVKEDLIGVIKDNPYLIESQKISGQFPLSFAFNQRDPDLVEIFARAEQAFFPDDRDSQIRRNDVLHSAVRALIPAMVDILLNYGACAARRHREAPDLVMTLIIACEVRKKKAWCWSSGIDPQKEANAREIAESLVKHEAPLSVAVEAATAFGCRGAGCTRIRELGSKSPGIEPSAPPA